jgi:hypothetical protein
VTGSLPKLAIAMHGLRAPGFPGEARARIEALAGLGWGAIQIDATMAGLRARDLHASARRDLPGMLARRGLRMSGIDFIIPSGDFVDAARSQRAVDALAQAIALAGEWRGAMTAPVVVTELPDDAGADVLDAIARACERAGVVVADLGRAGGSRGSQHGAMGVCFDPARVIASGAEAIAAVIALGRAPAAARLTDFGGGTRVEAGGRGSRLDVGAYRAALDVLGFAGCVVADLRGLADQVGAARRLADLDSGGGGAGGRGGVLG